MKKLITLLLVVLMMVPIVLIYVFLQKYFIEGVERSGIVG